MAQSTAYRSSRTTIAPGRAARRRGDGLRRRRHQLPRTRRRSRLKDAYRGFIGGFAPAPGIGDIAEFAGRRSRRALYRRPPPPPRPHAAEFFTVRDGKITPEAC
ncbi:MAG: hypothetical protein R2719_14365 [Micropruina sp.]